jgi:hypothetical protein
LAGVFCQGSFSEATALCFYQLENPPQYNAVLVDLVARFAALKWREERFCKVFPGNPQQFR